MADAWRVPAILTLLVGCWHVVGPLERFKKALALILDKAKLIVAACTRCVTRSPGYPQGGFFLEGIAFDEIDSMRGSRSTKSIQSNVVTASLFEYLAAGENAEKSLVTQIFASWKQLSSWLRQTAALKRAA